MKIILNYLIKSFHQIKIYLAKKSGQECRAFQYPPAVVLNPFMPTGAFNICCLRDCVSRTANVERTGQHKCVKDRTLVNVFVQLSDCMYSVLNCTPCFLFAFKLLKQKPSQGGLEI